MGRKGKNTPAGAAAAAPTYVPKQIVKLDDLPPPVPVVTPPWEEVSGPTGPRDEADTESSSSPAALP